MFPARKLGGASSGGGEWLVAFRTAERERFRAILSYFPRTVSPPSRRNINTPMSDSFRPLIFSRPLLLELHGITSPQDLCVAHVSGLGLCEWNEEDSDLDTFVNLVEIDASDNALQLEAFYQLTALRRLDLSVNQISHVTVQENNLTRLQVCVWATFIERFRTSETPLFIDIWRFCRHWTCLVTPSAASHCSALDCW